MMDREPGKRRKRQGAVLTFSSSRLSSPAKLVAGTGLEDGDGRRSASKVSQIFGFLVVVALEDGRTLHPRNLPMKII